MSESGIKKYVNCRASLLDAISRSEERAKAGKDIDDKLESYRKEIARWQLEVDELKEAGNHLRDVYKNIQAYSQHHQERARNILDLAIKEAGELVPDADVEGIKLQSADNGRVSVVNADGQNINLREGGGYRAVLGALLRYACLKAQPDALQFILFDEYFFTLSDTTTNAMKDIFLAMKKDMTIVCIEQRRNAMDGIVDAEYTFKKDLMKNTSVEKTI